MWMRNSVFSILIFGVILCTSCTGGKNSGVDNPNYTHDIVPILNKNCNVCHSEKGVAPFALTTYKQVRKKAKTIIKVTTERTMPPWPADPEYTHFIGEKYLSEFEINTLKNWLKNGLQEGPKNEWKEFVPPHWKSSIGKPDLILHLDSVLLMPDFKDRFYLMKIPGTIARDTWVRAVEFIAGTPDQVHHFNGHLLLYEDDAKKNVFDGMRKVEINPFDFSRDFAKLKLENDDGSLPFRVHSAVNYLPGVFGTAYPEGIGGFKLSKKFAFVGNDMHYGPGDKKVTDKSIINVFYSKGPPRRAVSEFMLGTNGVSEIEPPLQIPANKITHHITKFTVNQDISVLTINPHLHMLGKTFLAYAIKPNGDTVRLIRIPEWNFRWQYFYTFKKMVPIPKGSTIFAEAWFDNTANNPENPNQPPKMVGERLEFGGASMRATDEMFQFIVTYSLYEKGDENLSLETIP
jgi:hypothetical protein